MAGGSRCRALAGLPVRLHCVLLPEGCPWPIGRARAGAPLVAGTRVLCCGKRLLKHICHGLVMWLCGNGSISQRADPIDRQTERSAEGRQGKGERGWTRGDGWLCAMRHQDRLPESSDHGRQNQGMGLRNAAPRLRALEMLSRPSTPSPLRPLFAAGGPSPCWRRALPDGGGRW